VCCPPGLQSATLYRVLLPYLVLPSTRFPATHCVCFRWTFAIFCAVCLLPGHGVRSTLCGVCSMLGIIVSLQHCASAQ
jgi:hypothetical protein